MPTMSDNDLIRRGDALALQDMFYKTVAAEHIAALPADPRVEKLLEALREARSELESFINAEWPEARRAEYPHVQAKWECDMGVCWRIDAVLAAWEAGNG
jgi:hypothetical protein